MGEPDLANAIRESGRKLLSIDPPESAPSVIASQLNDEQTAAVENLSTKQANKKTNKGRKGGKKGKGGGVGTKSFVKPEQSRKVASFQKDEFLSLESYHLKSNNDGK